MTEATATAGTWKFVSFMLSLSLFSNVQTKPVPIAAAAMFVLMCGGAVGFDVVRYVKGKRTKKASRQGIDIEVVDGLGYWGNE